MAKSGRYSADRKKVENITAATKTVEVHDCGTIFVLNRSGGIALTLPSLASAGNGWWCKVVVQTALGSNATITSADGASTVFGTFASAAADANASSTLTHDGEVITIAAAADQKGDFVEIIQANGEWFVNGIAAT